MSSIANNLVDTVGNTPLFSVKDRMGRSMVVAASLKLGGNSE